MRTSALINCLYLLIASIVLTACDRTQTISLTAEDFRFVPDLVTVTSSSPLALSVYNAGREVHEFDSPVLMYAATTSLPQEKNDSLSGILIRPGQSLELTMVPPPGTYLYICRRKGHANMTGTLIVE